MATSGRFWPDAELDVSVVIHRMLALTHDFVFATTPSLATSLR
jgi:hypothetical protein